MKLCIMMLLVASAASAQVAPAPAPAMTLNEMVNQAIFAVVSAFLLFVINYAKTWITTATKKQNHSRGVSVVQDAFYSALSEANITLLQAQSDKDLKAKLDEVWLGIALARLDELYGFKKTDMRAWAKDQMGIFWGKLAAGKA